MTTLTVHDTVGPFKLCSYMDYAWGGRKFCLIDTRTGIGLDGEYSNLPAAERAAQIRLVLADYRTAGGQISYSGSYGPFDTEAEAQAYADTHQTPIGDEHA